MRMKRVYRRPRPHTSFESLETRQLMSAALGADVTQLVFGDVVGGSASASRMVKISNASGAPLTIPSDGISISGAAASQFHLTSAPSSDVVLGPGASLNVAVSFCATAIGAQGA